MEFGVQLMVKKNIQSMLFDAKMSQHEINDANRTSSIDKA